MAFMVKSNIQHRYFSAYTPVNISLLAAKELQMQEFILLKQGFYMFFPRSNFCFYKGKIMAFAIKKGARSKQFR